MSSNVIGLDLSTKRIGIATTSGELHSIASRTGAANPYKRLDELTQALKWNLREQVPAPDLVVIEDYALGSPGRLSLIRLGEIGGIVRTYLYANELPFLLVRPTTLKLFATGHGNADKQTMIGRAIELGARPDLNDDEADAYHLRRIGLATLGTLPGDRTDHETKALNTLSPQKTETSGTGRTSYTGPGRTRRGTT